MISVAAFVLVSLCFGCLDFVFFGRAWFAGSGPAAAHFLCFAKESKQRKATALRRPLSGVPGSGACQSGGTLNSLRSDKRPSLSDCHPPPPATQKRNRYTARCASRSTSMTIPTLNQVTKSQTGVRRVVFASSAMRSEQFELSASSQASGGLRKMDKRDACLSAASLAFLPFSAAHHWEPRRGQDRAVAFLCLLSLAKQRK